MSLCRKVVVVVIAKIQEGNIVELLVLIDVKEFVIYES
jgi:hypothetical protein